MASVAKATVSAHADAHVGEPTLIVQLRSLAVLLVCGCAGACPAEEPLQCGQSELTFITCLGARCEPIDASCLGAELDEVCGCMASTCLPDGVCPADQAFVADMARAGGCSVDDGTVVVIARTIDGCE
jgi:hypothetical protein